VFSGGQLEVTGNIKATGFFELKEQTAPADASAGWGRLYPKSDGKLYYKAGGGTEYDLTSSGGSLTGSGNVNRLAFWSGATALTSNANLNYDPATGQMGIGASSPGADSIVHVKWNHATRHQFLVENESTTGIAAVQAISNNHAVGASWRAYGTASGQTFLQSSAAGNAALVAYGANLTAMKFGTDVAVPVILGTFLSSAATGAEFLRLVPGAPGVASVVFNEQGYDIDTRIEANGDSNNFFSDASTSRIGIGTNTPSNKLHVYHSGVDGVARIENANSLGYSSLDFWSSGSQKVGFGYAGAAFGILQGKAYWYSVNSNLVVVANDVGSSATYSNVEFGGSANVFNEQGIDLDTRFEGDDRTHCLFVDAGAGNSSHKGRVGVNNSAPGGTLDIDNGSSAESPLIVRDNGTTVFEVADGGAVSTKGHSVLGVKTGYKTADQSKTSNASPALDAQVQVSLDANATYRVVVMTRFNLASDNPGLDMLLAGTVGINNVSGFMLSKHTGAPDVFDNTYSANPNGAGSSGDYVYQMEFTIETSTSGTLGVSWSQDTSHADAVTLKRGSYIRAERFP
jgi:hypothetical protein